MNLSQEYKKPIGYNKEGRFVYLKEDNGSVGLTSIPPELKEKLSSLYAYLSKRLGIKETPKVTLTQNEQNSEQPFGLTGYYDHQTKTIRVYITNRHDTDVLRSFAHEVIHHWQNLRGTLHPEEKSQNPVTHQTNPHYAQHDTWLRKREMEAYLFGNILFRDWQDENRSGPPKTQPFLPQPYD